MASADDDYMIVVAGPMTGQYADFGARMRAGAEAAIQTINADGGVGGRKLQLRSEDDACNRVQAVAVAQRVVGAKADLVIGHHCASASIAAAPIYAAAGVVMLSPGTTDPQLTNKRAGPAIFRLAWRDDAQGSASGTYLATHFAGKRVAVLHDRTVVGMQLANDTKKAMNAGGLTEVLISGFIAGERDYSQLARDLRARRTDVVYVGAYPSETDLIQSALRRDGQSIVVVASALLAAKSSDANVVARREGMLVTALSRVSTPTGNTIEANSHAAVQVWAAAVKATPEPQGVAKALQTGKYATILGEVEFDLKGDAVVPFYRMMMWKGGDLVPAP